MQYILNLCLPATNKTATTTNKKKMEIFNILNCISCTDVRYKSQNASSVKLVQFQYIFRSFITVHSN